MSRYPQKSEGARGSLKWMLRAVNSNSPHLQPSGLPPLTWVSPLQSDDYAEYRDALALKRLGLQTLVDKLPAFWPNRGPQWDGLATFDGGVVLVEAKAHIAEFRSPASQAGPKSRAVIQSSFAALQKALGLPPKGGWDQTFYQYTNRLAHLWWLRENGIDAHLLFVDFLGDHDMGGPDSPAAWKTAFEEADTALGLPKKHALSAYVHHIYPDVRHL